MKKCKSPTTDFQQCEAYAWEDSWTIWAGQNESKQHICKLIYRSAKLYRIPLPEVRFLKSDKRGKRWLPSSYDPSLHRISLRPRHMRANVAVHEVAHAIVDYIMGPFSKAGHGKAWLGVYMELLAKWKFMSMDDLKASATRAGLKFSTRVHWNTIRKNHPKQTAAARAYWRMLRGFTKNKGPTAFRQ